MAICPTCHTSVDEAITQPTTSTLLASIAPPTDMSGVLPALQALIQNLNLLTGNGPAPNNNGGGGGGGNVGQQKAPPKAKQGRFVELTGQRVTADVKVYSKQDPSTFVAYKQINGMTFKDSVTGELWSWGRGG